MAGVYKSRLPTLAVLIALALFIGLLTLILLPRPEDSTTRHSVVRDRQKPAPQHDKTETKPVAADHVPETVRPANDTAPPPEEISAPLAADAIAQDDMIQLSPAPDSALTEKTPTGLLPAIAGDGRQPWQVYARPTSGANKGPRIAIVVAPLGADKAITNAAIDRLPGVVTLAFDASYAAREDGLARARKAGHETLLIIPAEPFDYPNSDPGPDTLLSSLPVKENIRRLQEFLKQGSGYIGITTLTGSRFVNLPKAVTPVLEELRHRGLALLDARLTERDMLSDKAAAMKIPAAAVDFRINADLSPEAIDQTLAQAARSARQSGQVVCLVMATPLVIDRLNRWLIDVQASGIKITPLSAVLR